MKARRCTDKDLSPILTLVNHEIEHGVAHFGQTAITPEELITQFESRGVYPWLVVEDDGEFCGFSKSGPLKPREAYRWSVEVSIYLCQHAQGRGLGKLLYRALFDELESLGFRRVLAGVVPPNPASERLHESLGMRVIGTQERVGFKHGRWHDVRYYQLDLPRGSDADAPPAREPGT
ncbi:MAG: N-acetyltransferase family protein [Planctomycetota bacterium]